MNERRLPVYLVIDTSGSMDGSAIEQVRNGIQFLLGDLRDDADALETAWLSVITFDSQARQLAPLTELESFQVPQLHASGQTALGPALRLLSECRAKEIVENTEDQRGDWYPLVFLMTDGRPNVGSVDDGIAAIQSQKWGNVICLGAGQGSEDSVLALLKRIADVCPSKNGEEAEVPKVLHLRDLGPSGLKAYFKWVSQSIKKTSKKLNSTGESGEASPYSDLPPLPAELLQP